MVLWDPILKLFLLKKVLMSPMNSTRDLLKNARDSTNAKVEEKMLYPN